MEELYGECPYSCEHSVQSVSESCCFCCVGVRCPNNGLTESDSDDGHDQSKSDYRCCLGGQRLNSAATVVDRLVGTALFPPLSLSHSSYCPGSVLSAGCVDHCLFLVSFSLLLLSPLDTFWSAPASTAAQPVITMATAAD